MRIGVPEELKNHEYRAAIPSAGVLEAVRRGHQGGAYHLMKSSGARGVLMGGAALRDDSTLAAGLHTHAGPLTNHSVDTAVDVPWGPIDELMAG